MRVSVGADPELFLFGPNDVPVSAYGVIPGSKHKPFPVENGAVQVDGMALEFNITPANDMESFVLNLNSVMATLGSMIPKDLIIRAVAVAEFGHKYIEEQPIEAKRLGCDPDFCAWEGGAANQPPNGDLPFRTAAGHIHVGWTNVDDPLDYEHIQECCKVIKQLDYFLGLPSLLFDKDSKRRQMYGKPGCFRPKTYGAEYRVLSNQWLANDDLKRWVFGNVQDAMDRFGKGDFIFNKVDPTILGMLTDPNPDVVRVARVVKDLGINLPPMRVAV